MAIKGNPAERLYEILSNAKENVKKNSSDIYTNKTVKTIWALTFDIDKNDEEKVFLAVVEVIQQIESLKKVADRMNSIVKDDFVKEITGLERDIMNTSLDEKSYTLEKVISDTRLMALKAIAMGLDICNQYSTIDDEKIDDIRDKILQLINEINDLSISNDLKEIVIDNLERVDLMIDDHKLYGIEGVKGAVEKGFGNIMLNNELSELSSNDFEVKETLKKVLNLFGTINTIISFSKNVAPMFTEVAKNFFLN